MTMSLFCILFFIKWLSIENESTGVSSKGHDGSVNRVLYCIYSILLVRSILCITALSLFVHYCT